MASDRPEIVSMMRHAQSPTLPAWIGKALLNACAPGAIASALRAPRTRPVAASNHRVERPLGSHSACCRSEEHTSELQSLMRISSAVFCLKKKKKLQANTTSHHRQNITNTINT